jgi:threonine aldolase
VIAQAVADTPGLQLVPPQVETNIVWVRVDPEWAAAKDVIAGLEQRGVRVLASGTEMFRACTHLDVSAAQAERAAEAFRQVMPRAARGLARSC